MRIVAALVLALVGLGVFPFYARTLSTGDLILAAISVALFFFAYRVATHKKKNADSTI
jgi:hypothetical protein